jgi:diadenosine tetraphosphate (Ap4A) HIT family hydrolase
MRVVLADEDGFAGFARVIWQSHVAEMSDLSVRDQNDLMQTVFAVESIMRKTLSPDKVNLASLGNQVAHLHWHVIARYRDDTHFPAPVWASAVRAGGSQPTAAQIASFIDAVSALELPE